jgi:hypothetical protein
MNQSDLIFFKKWVSDYCKSFYSSNSEDQKNICLKEQHTLKVCENIIEIAEGLSLGENHRMLAESIALFHDVGRFPQYSQYKTFKDSISVNHGVLGSKVLIEKKVLLGLPDNEQELIIQTVKFHNAFSIPRLEKEEIIFFIKLLRDADKLDIWRVFIEYYESPVEKRASAVGLGLPDAFEYSKDVILYILRKQVISLSKIKTLNDFKLLQLSWIYDLNFNPSFRLLQERDYIARIISQLPQTEEIHKVFIFFRDYVNQRLQED